jgi:hypothetical protein
LFYSARGFSFKPLVRSSLKSWPLSEDNFMADPFVVRHEDRHFIFFEEYFYSKGCAHISVIEYGNTQNISAAKIALERPYHLSYPFVFKWNERYYMVPETSTNRTVELYMATKFPYDWEWKMNLMEDIGLIDATLIFHNNKWWLFGNSNNHPFTSTNDQLFLYYSDSLLSTNWAPHPKNPVATHVHNCRPAGRIFEYHGKLYRPAQNNASQQYGYGLKINEIIIMSERDYVEKEVFSLFPDTLQLRAVHHLDFTDEIMVVDGIES